MQYSYLIKKYSKHLCGKIDLEDLAITLVDEFLPMFTAQGVRNLAKKEVDISILSTVT